ncbi:Twinfilin-1 [Amphibalanus amphitrite]|uniref:Twinfilin n=1 Tax=Amphibalanus amphitrite TaxID=1232801 RepID=A0A6A4V3K7_AMPAM|nr:Twinfilin-1 [Amphibalanus amphitrite]KAF0290878.1 Twinfilin-1 [Amphibalanus amphitrite]KAF0290879.1 Twinfilin-1 [Amphibalanus amphitrite]KAF0300023.1 Twinfilin-1 [Amphibalanus amphitrite]KAF0300024.1 Twinfilin-1 [Amphibalanus amphitrite]
MSHQTGITANDELVTFFGNCRNGSVRAVKISIENEQLSLHTHVPADSTWERDWDSVVPDLVDDKQPTYVLYRLDSKNSMGFEWLMITWSPDDSPVRQKMLYASTKATLKKEFGGAQIKDEVFATVKEDVTFNGYQRHLRAQKAPAPRSMAEEEKAEIRRAEVSVDVAVDTKQQTMGSVAFPISRDALDEISRLSEGRINYVQLSIDLDRETINLAGSDSTPVSALASRVPTDQARYHLYVFTHQYEGDVFHSLVFIYSMPGYCCSIRERMLYSSCKSSVIDFIENQCQLNITKKIEIDDPLELTEQFLLDEIHPKKMLHRPKFAKPKGPANRGAKRLTKTSPDS